MIFAKNCRSTFYFKVVKSSLELPWSRFHEIITLFAKDFSDLSKNFNVLFKIIGIIKRTGAILFFLFKLTLKATCRNQ